MIDRYLINIHTDKDVDRYRYRYRHQYRYRYRVETEIYEYLQNHEALTSNSRVPEITEVYHLSWITTDI
jgi:hypothetical protein